MGNLLTIAAAMEASVVPQVAFEWGLACSGCGFALQEGALVTTCSRKGPLETTKLLHSPHVFALVWAKLWADESSAVHGRCTVLYVLTYLSLYVAVNYRLWHVPCDDRLTSTQYNCGRVDNCMLP